MAMNSLLQHLYDEVILLTKRPDLVAATKSAVKASTFKLHQADFYYKDLFEAGISFSASQYLQQLDYKALIPRWRALKYVSKVSYDNQLLQYVPTTYLDVITPEMKKDDYGVDRLDVCYTAGEVLHIKSSTQELYFIVSCYLYPSLVDEAFESWIAREVEYAVIYDAAATVFKGIGFDEQAAQYRNDAGTWSILLKNSNILAKGE